MSVTDDPADTTAMRTWARQLFGEAGDDEQEHRRNVVPTEGDNPRPSVTDDARDRDFAARLFNDASSPELPEE